MKCVAATFAMTLAAGFAVAQEGKGSYDDALAKIQERSEAADREHADKGDIKVWPGVIADRLAKTVTIFAAATGVKQSDPIEFYVTPVSSGKDYEALTITPAKPSHVAEALKFIGMTPGLPVNPEKNRFWARGSRLQIRFDANGKTIAKPDEVLVDTNTLKPIPSEVLFAGSRSFKDEQGQTQFAADEGDAKSLAPTYEDPNAVLAVPRRAPQSVVYGFQKPAAGVAEWKRGDLVDLVLSPLLQMETVRRSELGNPLGTPLHIEVRQNNGEAKYAIVSQPGKGKLAEVEYDLPNLVAAISGVTDFSHADVFTDVAIEDAAPLTAVRNLYAVLGAIERDHGVKLNPPPPGHLYYRAFLPDEAWRDRSERLGEPWELSLNRTADGKLTAKLERWVDNPDRNASDKKIAETYTPADPTDFSKTVNNKASRWSRTIFVFPPADMTYGELMTWVRPVLATFPRVFVFPPAGATTQPSTLPTPGQLK